MKWLRHGAVGPEVERWQNFLCGFYPAARVRLIADGHFGDVTLEFTKKFQAQVGVQADGVVGNESLGIAARYGFPLVAADEDDDGPGWPKCPSGCVPLSDVQRETLFGKFSYVAVGTDSNPEAIKIIDDWDDKNIISVTVPQLSSVSNAPKNNIVRVHKKLEKQFVSMWTAWEEKGLIDKVKSWNGSYVPRFIRGSRTRLSNHSWGTAFDINVQWNGLGIQPALKGKMGSVRELVLIAAEHGFYWGGWFTNRPDGMHFEAFRVI